jgi:hypothetical protein
VQEAPIRWRIRWLMLWAGVRTLVTGRHCYLSTGCIAGEHDYCAAMRGPNGEKKPAASKFSNAPCICWCHNS